MRDAGVATVAMEVSSHALDQQRVDGTQFAAVCFTNLSHDHLDFHRTMDDYFAAKARLFTDQFSEHAAIGIGDPYGQVLRDRAVAAGLDVWTYAAADAGAAADITAEDVECTAEHTRFTLVSRRDARRAAVVSTTLLGDFNVANMLAAAATARAGELPFDAVADGLQRADSGAGPLRARRRRPRLRRPRRLRAHAGRARTRARGRPRARRGPAAALRSCTAAAVTGTAPSAR